MLKKNLETAKSALVFEVDPTECPFREFRDNELGTECWGLGPAACRAAILMSKTAPKPPADYIWVDDQTQPLPRSVRQYLHGWIRAEELAQNRWDAEVVIFEENNGGKMSMMDMQLSHAQVLMRSSFCRRVLSSCFILERVEGLMVEHQWENFVFNIVPEGWRARYHIYSPGLKAGGGPQHRPGLSKNGCYLVRLFYLGAWRCLWVSDQVPVDATDSPLLPFSPLLSNTPPSKPGSKQVPATATASVVYLWPLLLSFGLGNVTPKAFYQVDLTAGHRQYLSMPAHVYKESEQALLKLAAPDMSSDEDADNVEDELFPEFDIMHALTGCMNLTYRIRDPHELWRLLVAEVPVFTWDDDDDTLTSTIKSKSTKKPSTKEIIPNKYLGMIQLLQHCSMVTLLIKDTKSHPPYSLPGITPGYEMSLLVSMARDLPIKKPLPEPELALWKYYRWVDWARQHGLYEAYECPRTRFLRVNGLLKLSYAPHLLDVQSTESITHGFRVEHDKTNPVPALQTKKTGKELNRSQTGNSAINQQLKEELKEWVQYEPIQKLLKEITVMYFPSMFEFTSATSHPHVRVTKSTPNRAIDIVAPKVAPLYLQIDGPEENRVRMSLSVLHPRVMINSGIPIADHIEPAYLILEKFDWFGDCEIPVAKAFVQTRGYDTVEVDFLQGRHFCRLWVHSRLNWHVMLLSESSLLLGPRDLIESAAVRECPWAAKFLNNLSASFSTWIRMNRSNPAMLTMDKDFYRSYQPDLYWDAEVVGYNQTLLHWMFRQALQSLLSKRLPTIELRAVNTVLRHYFCDPDFGLPPKPAPPKPLKEIIAMDPCDCVMLEVEEVEIMEEQLEEQSFAEEKPLISPVVMSQLLLPPIDPIRSQVCELSTENLPCGILKEEREKVIRKHEAATCLQAHWRGAWARKCLNEHAVFSADVLKIVMDNSFGNLESLSALMNEFFRMYPGAKQAYSVASALSGVYGLAQHHGTSYITPKCKWIPYFQAVFHCHAPVKVHFDLQSSLHHSTVAVYNNDTGEQIPQTYNAHHTFNFAMNIYGYTVMAHGSLNKSSGVSMEAHWQLTVLTSIDGRFHVCDNDFEGCKELPVQPAYKLHIDEIFLPNRRNILGGILVSVTKQEAISFRAASTSPDLEMVATLRTTTPNHEIQEIARCTGKGEIYWPYIRLEPSSQTEIFSMKKKSYSHDNLNVKESRIASARSLKSAKSVKLVGIGKNRSTTRLRERPAPLEPKQYSIEVTAPSGWPLTLAQWKRVDEVRNTQEFVKVEAPPKKPQIRPSSAKDKDVPASSVFQPLPDDAYTELECSLAVIGGVHARRDDERNLEFTAARKSWEVKEPGRNMRGCQIRNEFRAEFLEALSAPPSESTFVEEFVEEEVDEEKKDQPIPQGPSPATESGILEVTLESEEEAKYLTMPEQLRDKFIPLYFLSFCLKENSEEQSVLITPDMAVAAKQDRHARIEAAVERMRELQQYNELYVLGRQKTRCQQLEKLFVDSQWSPELAGVLEERDNAIALETLNRTLSASKKKQDMKTKK